MDHVKIGRTNTKTDKARSRYLVLNYIC